MEPLRGCLACGAPLPPERIDRCPRCGLVIPDLDLGESDAPLRGLPPPPGPLLPRLLSTTIDDDPGPSARPCRRCGAALNANETVCFRCGQRLGEEHARSLVRRDLEPHRAPLIVLVGRLGLAFGLGSFGGVFFLPLAGLSVVAAALGIGATVMARDDLEQMERKTMDPEGEHATQVGQQCGLAGLILGIFAALVSLVVQVPTVLRG